MKNDPSEVSNRMTRAMELIDIDYPRETKFLKILIEQKLAPESFQAKIVNLMCDLGEAQAGLVGPDAALAAVENYVTILKILRNDATLSAEMNRLVPA